MEPSWPSQPDLRLFSRPPQVATHRFAASFLALLEPLALVPTVLLLESELLDSNHHFQQSHHLRKVPGSLFLQTFYIACSHRFGCSVFHRASPQIYHQLADTIRPLELQYRCRLCSRILGGLKMRLQRRRRARYLLELERSNGVCELMIDLRRRSMEDGTAEAMRAGNVEGLQKERTWNLSQVM